MSVQVNTYVINGVKFPYPDNYEDVEEKWESFRDSAYQPRKRGLVVLVDGMCGEYVLIGNVVESTENHAHLENPICLTDVSKSEKSDLVDQLKKHFDLTVKPDEIKTWVVSHAR